MKTTAYSLFSAMLLAAAVAHGGAENATSPQAPVAQPSMQRETLDEISATVVSVDPKTRIIELRGEEGRTGAFTAGPEVKNFAQVHPGDKVVVSYYRGIAAQVLPPGTTKNEVNQVDLAGTAEPGAKPGAAVGSAIRGTVIVQKVDTKANTITVRKPDGSSRTLPSRVRKAAPSSRSSRRATRWMWSTPRLWRWKLDRRPKGCYFSMR